MIDNSPYKPAGFDIYLLFKLSSSMSKLKLEPCHGNQWLLTDRGKTRLRTGLCRFRLKSSVLFSVNVH